MQRAFSDAASIAPPINNSGELTVLVDDVKITLLKYPFPTFDPFTIYEQVPLLSVREIAAIKAYTIGRRGAYKDIHLYFILSQQHAMLTDIIDVALNSIRACSAHLATPSRPAGQGTQRPTCDVTSLRKSFFDACKSIMDVLASIIDNKGEAMRYAFWNNQARLPSPYTVPTLNPRDFVTTPSQFNSRIPANIDLVCGDPLLELQANAINTLSNTQIPGANTWLQVIDWLNDFLVPIDKDYDTIFLDCNPSFSIYTQIGLASVERLVLPVMADDSSRRAVQNALSLVYGLRLPSPIYATYAFNTKLQAAGRQLPKVHLIVKNS